MFLACKAGNSGSLASPAPCLAWWRHGPRRRDRIWRWVKVSNATWELSMGIFHFRGEILYILILTFWEMKPQKDDSSYGNQFLTWNSLGRWWNLSKSWVPNPGKGLSPIPPKHALSFPIWRGRRECYFFGTQKIHSPCAQGLQRKVEILSSPWLLWH